MQIKLHKNDLELSKKANEALPMLMRRLVCAPSWSNGRDVDALSKQVYQVFALRCCTEDAKGSANQSWASQDVQVVCLYICISVFLFQILIFSLADIKLFN